MARRHRRSTPCQGVWTNVKGVSGPAFTALPPGHHPGCQGLERPWVRTAGSDREHLQPGSLAAQAEGCFNWQLKNKERDRRCPRSPVARGRGTLVGCCPFPRAGQHPGLRESPSTTGMPADSGVADPAGKGYDQARSPRRRTAT